MFWRFGGYANISTLDTILDKPDVTLEELLDESDLIQELKQNNSKLIEYLRDENILRRLLEYVTAPSPYDDDEDRDINSEGAEQGGDAGEKRKSKESDKNEEDKEKEDKLRLKYAYVACEVLSSETWSIIEALMENQQHLRDFWAFLKRKPSLDPLQASYFTKINETLLDKKTEEMLEFFKSLDNIVPDMLQHVDCPMVMDLLLKIISLEKVEYGQGIVDWLQSKDLIPILLAYLSPDQTPSTQTSAGDFLKAVITISANASQNEQSCIGPNDLTRQLVSEPCVRNLISDMLQGGNPLTVGVGIVIEVIRKNNSDYDPDVGTGADSTPSSHDPIYLGTLLREFAKHVPDFMDLILSPNHTVTGEDGTTTVRRKELKVAFGKAIEPLGFDRFKTCELMAELLHCSNMGLLNERGSEAFVKERDVERERLKAEGKFSVHRNHSRAHTPIEDDRYSPSAMESRSPEGRKLEVQNRGEEDGFEDVTVSGVLNEEVKDDFDEKPDEDESKPSEKDPFADVGGSEDDFVDEPLSSPGLEAKHEKNNVGDESSLLPVPELDDRGPNSPTTAGLTDRVDGLELEKDTVMAGDETSELDPPGSAEAPAESSESSETSAPVQGTAQSEDTEVRTSSSETTLSPHPTDKPAPLFENREQSTQSEEAESSAPNFSQEQSQSDGRETAETSHGAEGDSSRSILMSGDETGFEPLIETDIDGSPVVGDFLKIMFVKHRVVPTILDFFFRFPWNNFLHNVVYDVVQQVFNGPMDRGYNRQLAIDLFETGRIIHRIVEGQERSDKAQAETNLRLGYMGHLTLIAEEVVKFTERHPAELLSQSVLDKVISEEWINYVEQTLAETRERDNAILGGVRPDLSVGPRQAVMNAVNAAQGFGNGASSALADAGLNGGGSSGLDSMDLASSAPGGFSLGGGSLLSGFGSSSDEEDEEMEEAEEDEGTRNLSAINSSDQFARYISSLSSSSPLSINSNNPSDSQTPPPNAPPPPPPSSNAPAPLNIPPSRARRQLAARLAMRTRREREEAERQRHGNLEVKNDSSHGKGERDAGRNNATATTTGDEDDEDDGWEGAEVEELDFGQVEGLDEVEGLEDVEMGLGSDSETAGLDLIGDMPRLRRLPSNESGVPGFANAASSENSESGGDSVGKAHLPHHPPHQPHITHHHHPRPRHHRRTSRPLSSSGSTTDANNTGSSNAGAEAQPRPSNSASMFSDLFTRHRSSRPSKSDSTSSSSSSSSEEEALVQATEKGEQGEDDQWSTDEDDSGAEGQGAIGFGTGGGDGANDNPFMGMSGNGQMRKLGAGNKKEKGSKSKKERRPSTTEARVRGLIDDDDDDEGHGLLGGKGGKIGAEAEGEGEGEGEEVFVRLG
ncbi:MAG: hypothetical protein M1819_005591 [Sarea resinae]|nr:MAG: hypothetical protein M1819_005591 [Sarea resinae]